MNGNGTSGRFEFRVFGEAFADREETLASALTFTGRESSDDLYLLDGPSAVICKLRDETVLDLKRLAAREDGLERWDAIGACRLPVEGSALARLLDSHRQPPEPDPSVRYDAMALIQLFTDAGFNPVGVRKDRKRYAAGGCLAELTRVRDGNRPETWSLAIESGDKNALQRLRRQLDLSDSPNVSYPQWLGATALAVG